MTREEAIAFACRETERLTEDYIRSLQTRVLTGEIRDAELADEDGFSEWADEVRAEVGRQLEATRQQIADVFMSIRDDPRARG